MMRMYAYGLELNLENKLLREDHQNLPFLWKNLDITGSHEITCIRDVKKFILVKINEVSMLIYLL